jgi:hypothetical protein
MAEATIVGRCIYCRSEKEPLTREHIIPAGLNGTWVLQRASCEVCRRISSAFETDVLRIVFLHARAGLGFRTTRGHPDTLPLLLERAGTFAEVEVPLAQYPAVILFPTFALPAELDNRAYSGGIDINGQVVIQVAGPSAKDVGRQLGAKSIRFTTTFHGHSYPRLIAKVAYGVAVANLGLDIIEEAYVLPAIRGESNDIGRWLGCDGREQIIDSSYLHGIRMAVVNGDIIARVRLFAQFGAPEYIVLVGKALRPSPGITFRPQNTMTRTIPGTPFDLLPPGEPNNPDNVAGDRRSRIT